MLSLYISISFVLSLSHALSLSLSLSFSLSLSLSLSLFLSVSLSLTLVGDTADIKQNYRTPNNACEKVQMPVINVVVQKRMALIG